MKAFLVSHSANLTVCPAGQAVLSADRPRCLLEESELAASSSNPLLKNRASQTPLGSFGCFPVLITCSLTGVIDMRLGFSRMQRMNDRSPNMPDDSGDPGEGTGKPGDDETRRSGEEFDDQQSLPDHTLFFLALEQLRRGDDADIRPIKTFQGRFGPVGIGWARRRFNVPFSEGLEIVTTADTEAWLYVLHSAPDPTLTAWRTRYFGVIQRQSLYQLKRQNRSSRLPDEADADASGDFAADSLSRDELASYCRTVTAQEGRGRKGAIDFAALESQALKKCAYCANHPRLSNNPPGERCLLLWKFCQEDHGESLTLKELAEKTGLTFHHVRTAYAECQRRLRDFISQ